MGVTCAIMQPTYLPWIGYFQLMKSVDVFILLTDVPFAKRSWQQRNRIVLNGKEHYLTVPVKTKGKRDQLISEVEVVDERWRDEHEETLRHAYGASAALHLLPPRALASLADNNEASIRAIAAELGISTKIMRSEALFSEGKKSRKLLSLCEAVSATTYVSPLGSKAYIEEEGLFASSEVTLRYQDYSPVPYAQKGTEHFIPYMSVLDIVGQVGVEEAKKMLGDAT